MCAWCVYVCVCYFCLYVQRSLCTYTHLSHTKVCCICVIYSFTCTVYISCTLSYNSLGLMFVVYHTTRNKVYLILSYLILSYLILSYHIMSTWVWWTPCPYCYASIHVTPLCAHSMGSLDSLQSILWSPGVKISWIHIPQAGLLQDISKNHEYHMALFKNMKKN